MRYAGNVVSITKKQNAPERLLMCQRCTQVWVEPVVETFPLSQFPCAFCEAKGYVYIGVVRAV